MQFTAIGFIELLAILTQLGSFGVDANPNAPTSAEVMKYAPAQADYMVYVDLQAVLPNNYKTLVALPGKLKSSPAQTKLRKLVTQIETARGMARGMIGMDPVTGIKSIAAFAKLTPGQTPQFMVVIRGKFPTDLLTKLAVMASAATLKVHATTTMQLPNRMGLAAVAKDGSLILGNSAWVKARLSPTWKPVRHARNSLGGHAAQVLRTKPFLSLLSAPSASARTMLAKKIGTGGPGLFIRDLLTGHKFAQLSLAHNGINWTWADRGAVGYKRAVLASEGAIDVFRALHFGTRGIVKFGFAALGSFAHKHPVAHMLVKHQAQLLKVLGQVTGNGRFRVRWRKTPRTHTMAVKAWAKELTHVIPLGIVVPAVAAGVFFGLSDGGSSRHSPPSHPRPTVSKSAPHFRPPANRLDVRRTYRKVKKQYLN